MSEQDAKDALRYRWLRNFRNFAAVDARLDTTDFQTLDAAVDAAMAQDPLHCDGCGKTIAEHDHLLRCPRDDANKLRAALVRIEQTRSLATAHTLAGLALRGLGA